MDPSQFLNDYWDYSDPRVVFFNNIVVSHQQPVIDSLLKKNLICNGIWCNLVVNYPMTFLCAFKEEIHPVPRMSVTNTSHIYVWNVVELFFFSYVNCLRKGYGFCCAKAKLVSISVICVFLGLIGWNPAGRVNQFFHFF